MFLIKHIFILSFSDPQRREIPFRAFQAHCHWSDTPRWTLIGRSERGLSHHSRTFIWQQWTLCHLTAHCHKSSKGNQTTGSYEIKNFPWKKILQRFPLDAALRQWPRTGLIGRWKVYYQTWGKKKKNVHAHLFMFVRWYEGFFKLSSEQ